MKKAITKMPVSKKGEHSYKTGKELSLVKEPVATYTSRIRAIGNSKGVILNNQLIEVAGLQSEKDILIHARDGVIYIVQDKDTAVNKDLSTWDKQFKAAIKKGSKPDNDLFKGLSNEFDTKEW